MKKIYLVVLIVGLFLLAIGVVLTVLSYINIPPTFPLPGTPDDITLREALAIIGFIMTMYAVCFNDRTVVKM